MPFYVVKGLVLTFVVYMVAAVHSHDYNPMGWNMLVSIIAAVVIWKCWDDE